MKKSFKGFYNPSEDEIQSAWLSEKTLFIFDTNVFLNLYSYSEQTREDLLSALEKIKNQIWIPYHVGLEYQRNRINVIKNEKSIFSTIDKKLEQLEGFIKKEFKDFQLNKRFPALHKETETLENSIKSLIESYKEKVYELDKAQPCVRSEDKIRLRLDDLLDGKIGDKPKQTELDEIYKNGKIRYENEISPGYKDSDKSGIFFFDSLKYEKKYGDLILWKQILDKANKDQIENVIFVTDDVKKDWWHVTESKGKKIIGPDVNLQQEIYNLSSVKFFHMYNSTEFLSNSQQFIEISIKESSIDEINDSIADANSKVQAEELLHSENLIEKLRDLGSMYIAEQLTSKSIQDTLALSGLNEQLSTIRKIQESIAIPDLASIQRAKNSIGISSQIANYAKQYKKMQEAIAIPGFYSKHHKKLLNNGLHQESDSEATLAQKDIDELDD